MKKQIQKQIIVTFQYHSQRIDTVIAQLLPEYSRSQISTWIKNQKITLNQKTCKPKDKVFDADLIEINVDLMLPDKDYRLAEAENIPLEVIYEDETILIINKPAGLVVHPGAGNSNHTLVNALLHYIPELNRLPRAGIIHRLDKDTTGLLVVAKNIEAQTSLVRQMQARNIQRHYLALVQGQILSSGTIDTYFGRHSKNRLKMAVTSHGRQAITHYQVKKRYPNHTLLDVQLMTGRTHQIRVHLAHIHHPIVGDPLYGKRLLPAGNDDELRTSLQQFKRQALHAYSLSFSHPSNLNLLTFTAPIPDDFTHLLLCLERQP